MITRPRSCYRQNPAVVLAEIDGVATLFNPDTYEYLVLNATGSAVWTLIKQPKTLEHIVADLLDHYKVAQSRCLRDVSIWLEDALSRSLILEGVSSHEPC
jgi:hypothetical protein